MLCETGLKLLFPSQFVCFLFSLVYCNLTFNHLMVWIIMFYWFDLPVFSPVCVFGCICELFCLSFKPDIEKNARIHNFVFSFFVPPSFVAVVL